MTNETLQFIIATCVCALAVLGLVLRIMMDYKIFPFNKHR
jgi:hypothetical protein